MANAAAAGRPDPLAYQTQRAIILQRADREVVNLLLQAQRDILRMLHEVQNRPAGIGRDIREAQLRLVQRNLHAELGKVWRDLGFITEARRAEAAARAIDFNAEINKFRLLTGGVADGAEIADKIALSEASNAASGIDRMIARTSGASYVPLKDRVYNSSVGIGSQVDRMVNSALIRGLSAAEFAKEVRQFINPLTPGGVRYAAMRLARTEINNAAHAASIQSVRETPWVEKMEWKLSGSHGRPDVCDQLAKGGANHDGRYQKTAVPSKPHPQCLCYVIPVADDDEEFENKLLAGHYNQYLDRYRNLQPGQVVRSGYGGGFPGPPTKTVAPKPVKATKTATPKPAGAKPTSQTAPPTPGATSAAKPIEQKQHDFALGLLKGGTRQGQAIVQVADKFGIPQSKALHIVVKAQKQLSSLASGVSPVKATAGRLATGSARVTPQVNAEALRRKINIPGTNGTRILQEMERQSALVPRTANALQRIDYADAAMDLKYGVDSNAIAYYVPSEQRIFMQRWGFEDRYVNVTFPKEVKTGWCSRVAPGASGDQAVFAHEFGHHVSNMIRRLPYDERKEFWQGIAGDLGTQPPFSASIQGLQDWLTANKSKLSVDVSRYGASDPEELLAEIWHEYSKAGTHARAGIKKAGERMRQLAERGAP